MGSGAITANRSQNTEEKRSMMTSCCDSCGFKFNLIYRKVPVWRYNSIFVQAPTCIYRNNAMTATTYFAQPVVPSLPPTMQGESVFVTDVSSSTPSLQCELISWGWESRICNSIWSPDESTPSLVLVSGWRELNFMRLTSTLVKNRAV